MAHLTEELLEKYAKAKTKQFHTKVKGISFAAEKDPFLIDCLSDNDVVYFNAELDNPYDDYAVAVIHDQTGKMLGHVPKEISEEIWKNIVNKGELYVARITLTGGEDKHVGVNLNVRHCYFDEQ